MVMAKDAEIEELQRRSMEVETGKCIVKSEFSLSTYLFIAVFICDKKYVEQCFRPLVIFHLIEAK